MAGETSWTPGPWHALDSDTASGLEIRGGGHHYPLAKVCSYWDGPGPREEEAKANYRLIAAAPEMAEELLACRGQFAFYVESHAAKGTSDGDRKAATNQAIVERIDAVLAKIGGAA